MLSKFELSRELFLKYADVFVCPICFDQLCISQHSLVCQQNHLFDISRKGYVRLLAKEKKLVNDLYDDQLFSYRRTFIKTGFYDFLHKKIVEILKEKKVQSVLDLGCGEGTHGDCILKQKKLKKIIGCDLSPSGIQMATDYINDGYLPIVADAFKLPFKEESFDAVIDILSPFMHSEVLRVLKKKGVFIKVSPTSLYLKEIRDLYGFKEYEKEEEVLENLKKHFKNVQKVCLTQEFPLRKEDFDNLIHMTPLMEHQSEKTTKPLDHITISLNIYTICKDEQ